MEILKKILVVCLLFSFSFVLSIADDMSIVSYDETHATKSNWRTNEEVRTIYEKWLVDYGKSYNDLEEKEQRFQVFKENLKYIDYRNSQNLSFKLGLTSLTDLTNKEYQTIYAGGIDKNFRKHILSNFNDSYLENNVDQIPQTVDWRQEDAVSEVQNQGKCQCCWAFTAIAAVEEINKIVTGKLITLSKQQIVDCAQQATGCDPGWISKAYDFIKNNGVNTEVKYPYTSINGVRGKCNPTENVAVVQIDGYASIKRDENEIKSRVAQQPIGALVEAKGSDFQHYTTGVFEGNCGTDVDHAVPIIGYGTENGKDYWLIKNSWGKSWGEQGYMKLRRGKGTCGVNLWTNYPIKKSSPLFEDKKYIE